MYFLFYQKDDNETPIELPIFIYLSLLTNLAQKL